MSELAKTVQRPAMRAGFSDWRAMAANSSSIGDAEALGLLVEKGAGAGGAEVVHGHVAEDHALEGGVPVDGEELAVLAADLDDGADVGVEAADGAGLGDELVDVEAAEQVGDGATAGAGEADAGSARFEALEGEAELRGQGFGFGQDGLAGATVGTGVACGEHGALRVEGDDFDGGGADVDTKGE